MGPWLVAAVLGAYLSATRAELVMIAACRLCAALRVCAICV
jgi:hypothetical protein